MERKQYKRLHYEDRRTIEKMFKEGNSIVEIAAAVGTHRDTIYKELKRSGTDELGLQSAERSEQMQENVYELEEIISCLEAAVGLEGMVGI